MFSFNTINVQHALGNDTETKAPVGLSFQTTKNVDLWVGQKVSGKANIFICLEPHDKGVHPLSNTLINMAF